MGTGFYPGKGSSLDNPKGNTYRLMWMLGAAMTVPLILVSGPLAGYCIGRFVFVKYLGLPGFWTPVFVLLGFAASAMQIFQLIRKIKQFESTMNGKEK